MADNQYWPLQPKQTTASDIRKVVANGTKTTGKWFTIANKEELEQKEASKQNWLPKSVKIGWNVGAKVWANVWLNTGKTIQQTTPVKKEKPQWPVVQPTITPQQITGDLFKNPIVQPINDIKVLHKDWEAVNANGSKMKVQPNQYNYNSSKLIKTDTERKKDLSAWIEALYADAYNKVTDWQQLTLEEVLGNENYKKQFDWVDEGRIQELINDANILAQYDEFDMQNLLSIYDKYKDFGLLLDVNKLSPKSKTAFISAIQGEWDNAIDKWVWQYMDIANVFSPLFWAEKAWEGFVNLTWLSKDKKTTKDLSQQIRERAANNKHDMLNEEEQNFAARDEIAKLDEKYKKYYTIDKDWNKKWNSMSKQNKYDEELMYIQNDVAKKHGDTLWAFWKNAFLNTIEVAATVHDMVANPWELIWWLGSTAVGTAENVASYGWDVYDWVKGNTMALHHKDVTQHLADLWWYDNYEEALQSAEYKLKDSPFKDLWMTILKQIQIDSSTAWLMGDYIAESYGSTDKFVESMWERPVETWSDIVSMLELWAFLSGKFGLISPTKSEALINTLWNLDPFELGMKYGNKLNYWPVLKGETAALKLWWKTLRLPFKWVKNMGDMIVNKLSWLSEEERKFIRENPDDVDKFIKWEENSQSLIDRIVQKFDDLTSEKRKEGEEYENIRNSNVNVATKWLIDWIEEKLWTIWAKLTDKWIKLSKRFTPAIENKVKELYTYINDLRKKGNGATAEDLHWLRQQLDTVASWEKIPQWLEATFVNMVKDIRRLVDNSLKDQVPWMAEIDANYRTILADIKALRQDWFNKDWTLKDSAYSKIRNLTNKWTNQPKLERLETLIPWITQDLKALAISETVEKASKQMVGQYAQQIRWVGGWITAITSLLTWGFSIPSVVLGLLGMQFATPKNLVSLLKFWGRIDKKINWVLDKIKNWTKLTALETAELARYLNENREDLREKAEYMHEKGLLSDEEYKAAMKNIDETEYARAQDKARNKAWDVENKMDEESKAKVLDFVKKRAKDVWFTTEVVKNMEKDTQGFTDLRNKLIALEKNPWDTTAQHELFHAFFSVVDDKTKAYLIQEARKILKENWMDVKNAEEWLAESFWIYAKRKMIDMGLIKAPKSFTNSLRNFFQKVYEYIQKFNWDRATINKVFDEVLGERKMKNWIIDLSDLLWGKKVEEKSINDIKMWDNWLRKKSVYHGSPADFDKFDSSHMGEWEWAQAHGWGHYVAVEERTWKHYAEMGKNRLEYKWLDNEALTKEYYDLNKKGEYTNRMWEIAAAKAIFWEMEWGMSFSEAKKTIKDRLEKWTKDSNNWLWKKELEEIDNIKEWDIVKKSWRNLYSLDIPDPVKADTPTGSNYLDEHGKLTEKEVNKFVDKLDNLGGWKSWDDVTVEDIKKLQDAENWWFKQWNEFVKAFEHSTKPMRERLDEILSWYSNLTWVQDELLSKVWIRTNKMNDVLKFLDRNKWKITGRDMYKQLERFFWSDKEASKFLESLWYDWIHYFWWRDWEAYVIFNDDALKIKDHIRYKKKIWDKEVEITPKVTSPDQLIEKNADWLSVMKSFISEKQAEKALNVSKDILDEDGNAYLWTHTNKYKDSMFSQFENTKDNRYKDFADTEVAFFSNSEDMSKSYADQKSKLAPTKKFNSVEEVNDYFKKNPVVEKWEWWHETENEIIKNYRMVKAKNLKWEDYWKLESQKVEKTTYDSLASLWDAYRDDWMQGNLWEMPKNPEEAIKILKEKRFWDATEIKQLKNWKVEKKDTYDWEYVWWYDTDKEAIAKWYAEWTNPSAYHYQWIIQDVKNPLVVDVRNPDWTQTFWNKLWNAKDFIKKEYPKFDKYMDKVEEKFNEAYNAKKSFDVWMDSVNDKKWELQWEAEKLERGTPEREKATEKVTQLRLARDKIERIFMWYVEPLTAEERAIPIKNNRDLWFYYDIAKEKYDKYKDVYDIWKWYDEVLHRENPNIWTAYTEAQASLHKGFFKFLENQEWFDKWLISLLHRWMPEEINLYMFQWGDPIRISLWETKLQTNDYVFYALSKWGYDWVIFKNISDYGWDSKLTNWWDVLTTFKSKNFKSWDNSNPTDSKYISYKKKVSLDKKSEWLQKKNSSWLLAKGRERMWDNGMRYKKSEYEQAVESWDKEKALWMIRKAAAEKGYDSSSDYQWSKAFNGSAPSSEWYTKAERINPDTEMYSQTLGDYASDGVDIWDLDWQLTDRWNYIRWDEYIRESIDNLNKAVREYKAWNKNAKIKMYRAIDADIKENWFRNGDWITPSKKYAKMHIWLQDWKKWRIIEEEVPIENIWWDNNDINEWWYDDGKEYWYKNTPNNKKELWITYDDKGKLIPLEKRFDEKNPDVRFKKKWEVPEDKKLVWLHNLGIDKLRWVIELWGMPMPSIAVTKKWVPHESYWDITFIMKESAINPALSRKNRLYTVDWYTPTVPQPTIRVKDTKEANLLMDKIQKETGIWYWELMQWLEYHDDRYFKDYPKLKEFDKYYDQLTEKKLFDWFTYTGKRRYKDYNLDNIVKSMVGNKRDAFNGAFWKMVAQSQWNTTVEKLRDRKYWLKDKDLAEKIWEKYYDALKELASKKWIEQKIESLSDYWRFAENVSDAYRANTDAWWRELTQWDGAEKTIYSKITKEDLEPLQKIIKEAAELPRPYSEAKPERAIRFDEVWAVVAPEGKLKEVKDMLKDTWLKVYWYKDWERMSVVDKVADDNGLRFKKKVDQTQTPEFKKWFEGSKVVNEDWTPMKVYHWTHGDFTVFDREKIGSNTNNKGIFWEGFYFTNRKSYWDYYAQPWFSKDYQALEGKTAEDIKKMTWKTMETYLDIKNPFRWNEINTKDKMNDLIERLGLKQWDLRWNNTYKNQMAPITEAKKSIKFREALQNAGYDGVIYEFDGTIGWEKQMEIVAFEPSQIKSATDNIWTFDKNNPDIRYKKWLEKKENWLERKKVSTASSFQSRVDNIANELWVKWWNTVQKMKRINKIIKEDKYKWTDIKKRFYQLKWEYKKQYIINNDKKIKDKWFKRTTLRVWQNWKKADWHFTKKQYEELKELWYIE